MKELDGASTGLMTSISALPKKGQGRELKSLGLHRINLINS